MNLTPLRSLRWLALASCTLFVACGNDTPSAPTDTTAPADSAPDDTLEDVAADDVATDTTEAVDTVVPLCPFVEPPCSDEQISALFLKNTASGGGIVDESTTAGEFLSFIDAAAGGSSPTLAYTYARFTETGLERVGLSDWDALESMDWDIAFRRFIIRLNSGVSGPSCVLGGRTGPATVWEELTALPDGVTMRAEQYFTGDGCEYVPETSGLGSPLTILSSFWSYAGCVAMTGNIYVLALRDGRRVKLQILSYYSPAVQATCNQTDSAPAPNGSGNVRMRWAFID